MKYLISFLQLIRFGNVAFTALAVIVGGWIASPGQVSRVLLLGAISAALIAAGANAYNDSCDVESDRINHPNRPLVRGILSKRVAVYTFILLTIGGCYLGTLLPGLRFTTPIAVTVFLFLYNQWWKRVPWTGNFIIAVCGALAPVFGAWIVGNVKMAGAPGSLAFFAFLMREMAKDAQDIPGDRAAGFQTGVMSTSFSGFKTRFWFVSLLLANGLVQINYDRHYSGVFFSRLFTLTAFILVVVGFFSVKWIPEDTLRSKRISLLCKIMLVSGMVMLLLGRSGV